MKRRSPADRAGYPPSEPDRGTCDRALLDELAVARQAGREEDEAREPRRAAGGAPAEIARRWRSGVTVRLKGPIDPVTDADVAAERAIIELIGARYPDDTIVAEESGVHAGATDAERRWLIDPLDGTTNFSHGFPHFCVSIASADETGPRVAVVAEPLRGWVFDAVRGGGARLDDVPIAVSATGRIERALLATGFPYDRHSAGDNNSHRFAHALRRTQGMRRAGSAALDLAFVAAGWLDGYWEYRLNPWDLAAGALLVHEAGGQVSTPTGSPWYLHHADIVATNRRLHAAVVALLTDAGDAPLPEDARP